jgi:hypothetical protein
MAAKTGGNASEMIRQVITEIDAQISELTRQRAQLAQMVSGGGGVAVAAPGAPVVRRRGRPPGSTSKRTRKRREFSEETKAKLKAAAKARWARYRAEKKSAKA